MQHIKFRLVKVNLQYFVILDIFEAIRRTVLEVLDLGDQSPLFLEEHLEKRNLTWSELFGKTRRSSDARNESIMRMDRSANLIRSV